MLLFSFEIRATVLRQNNYQTDDRCKDEADQEVPPETELVVTPYPSQKPRKDEDKNKRQQIWGDWKKDHKCMINRSST